MLKITALLVAAIFVLCDSAAILEKVNKKEKCSIKDDECFRSFYRSIVQEVAENGIPEMDIPKKDPLLIKYLNVQALGMLNVTLTDATLKGLKNCYSTSYKNDIESRRFAIEYVCDIYSLEGHFEFESTPVLLALTGGIRVHGKGLGSAVVEKLKLNMDLAYEVKRHADCELHYELNREESSHSFDVLGKMTVSGGNVFVGKQDISTVSENIFNENWKTFSKIFGQVYFNKALDLFYEDAQKFFDSVPIKEFVMEDLSEYVSL